VFNETDFDRHVLIKPADVAVAVENDNVVPLVTANISNVSTPVQQQLPACQVVGESPSPVQVPRRSQRQVRQPERFGEWIEGSKHDELVEYVDVAQRPLVIVCISITFMSLEQLMKHYRLLKLFSGSKQLMRKLKHTKQ